LRYASSDGDVRWFRLIGGGWLGLFLSSNDRGGDDEAGEQSHCNTFHDALLLALTCPRPPEYTNHVPVLDHRDLATFALATMGTMQEVPVSVPACSIARRRTVTRCPYWARDSSDS